MLCLVIKVKGHLEVKAELSSATVFRIKKQCNFAHHQESSWSKNAMLVLYGQGIPLPKQGARESLKQADDTLAARPREAWFAHNGLHDAAFLL